MAYAILDAGAGTMNSSTRWQITVNTPTGEQQGTLELALQQDTCSGRLFSDAGELLLEDGKRSGDSLAWTLSLARPIPITLKCQAQISAGEMSGNVTIAAFGNFSFTGRLSNDDSNRSEDEGGQ